jgi:formylglycine-generating enzyme required for sulfatase activity
MMESEDNEDQQLTHKVTIAKPFAIGRFSVTFDEWDGCVAGRGRGPVINGVDLPRRDYRQPCRSGRPNGGSGLFSLF